MSENRETKSAPLGLRVAPSTKAALEKAASADHRPVASYVEKLLVEHLRARGYLPGAETMVASAETKEDKA